MEEIKEKFSKEKFVPIKNITPLNSPQEFKKILLENIKESNKAYILCLYMGTGNEVKEVLELLKERKKKDKKTKIMLDYNRSKRTPELEGLFSEYGLTDDVTFFAPGYEFIFPLDLGIKHKMIELFTVLHSKLFIFDNQVILTGANLEDSYLTNRTDRYLLIEGKEFIVYATKIFYKYFTNSSQFDIEKFNIQNEMTVSFFYNEKREKEIFKKIFDIEFEEIYISTGYLNFPKEYLNCLKGKKVKIIIPSPQTSTYTQLKVFQNNVVESYSVIARDIKRKVKDAIIYEYNGPNSFHSKGVWLFKKDIAVTLCGSSNFNRRSTERDYESNFFILTKEKETIFKLKKEIKELEDRSKVRDLRDLENRNISLFTRIIEYFMNKFL